MNTVLVLALLVFAGACVVVQIGRFWDFLVFLWMTAGIYVIKKWRGQ